MTNVALPLILRAFYDAANELFGSDVEVSLGSLVVDPTFGFTYLTVGYDGDPTGEGQSASFTQSWATVTGPSRDEEGTVSFSVLAMVGEEGNEGAVAAMEQAFAVAESLGGEIRAGIDIPVTTLQWTDPLTDGSFELIQTTQGTEALLRFGIGYKARI